MTQSPEAIGEAAAADAWACRGRSTVLSASTYEKAVDELLKQSTNPAAKRAFDKRLAQIAADSPGIMRSNPRRRA